MINRIVTIFIVALYLCGCAGNVDDIQGYEKIESKNVVKAEIPFVELGVRDLLRVPMEITIDPVKDVFLVADDGYNEIIRVIDRESGALVDSFGTRGDGLGYLNYPRAILGPTQQTPDSTYVLEGFENKINVYNEEYDFVRQISIEWEGLFNSAKRISDRKIILSTSGGPSLVAFFDLDTEKLSYPSNQPLFPVPFDIAPIPEAALPEFFASKIAYNQQKDELYLAAEEIDVLQKYKPDGILIERFRGPDNFVPRGVLTPEGYFARIENSFTQVYCYPMEVIGDKLVVGYSGLGPNMDTPEDNSWENGNRLFIYDLDGLEKFHEIVMEDVIFTSGCVSAESEQKIYLIDVNPDKDGADIIEVDIGGFL